MDRHKKSLLTKEAVFPLIASLVAVVVLVCVLKSYTETLPFYKEYINVAGFNTQGIAESAELNAENELSLSELRKIRPNTSIGSIQVGKSTMPLVYAPSYENTGACFALQKDSALVGEMGNAVVYCAKDNAENVRRLCKGDTLSVATFYGEYNFVVEDIYTSHTVKSANGIGRSLTIYTDKSEKAGISNDIYAVSCRMTSGNALAE